MGINYSRLESICENKIEIIAKIHEERPIVWQDGYQVSEESLRKSIRYLKDKVSDPDFFLCISETESGEIVGFHWLKLESKNDIDFGHIGSLWVSEGYRKQGIGKRLKAEGEKWSIQQGAQYLLTEVFSENREMIKFNQDYGFHTGHVIMKKNLF